MRSGTALFLKRFGFYLPFTWHFLLFSGFIVAGYRFLQSRLELPDSSYKVVLVLLLKIALVFGTALLIFGFITVLVSFFYFRLKQSTSEISLKTGAMDKDSASQKVNVRIRPLIRPLLGFVRLRLQYDGKRYSKKFSLTSWNAPGIWNPLLEGEYMWDLPEIREYRVSGGLIYFEDMFQFFSVAVPLRFENSFYNAAPSKTVNPVNASPRRTEETETRIEELKKVEGELLNYKNFETSDDVRRIVWKIYAKNRELVVRIPEIADPYASHVYMAASFYRALNLPEELLAAMLDYYKTICWSVYRQLSAKGINVRFRPDQELSLKPEIHSEHERVHYLISTAAWHSDKPLKEIGIAPDLSVLLISSFSSPEEVSELLSRSGRQLSVLLVRLSDAFEKRTALGLLSWIFIQEEKDAAAVLRTRWRLSPQRARILENEKVLGKLISEYQRSAILSAQE